MLAYEADFWQETFIRHTDNLKRGPFCPNYIAYEPLGEVSLDSGELTLKGLSDCLPPKVLSEHLEACHFIYKKPFLK